MRECKLCKLTSYMPIQEMLCWENVMFSILNTGSFIPLYVHVCACIIARDTRLRVCEFDNVFASVSCCFRALQHFRESNESQKQAFRTMDSSYKHRFSSLDSRRDTEQFRFKCIYTYFYIVLIIIIQTGSNQLTRYLFRGYTFVAMKRQPIYCSQPHTPFLNSLTNISKWSVSEQIIHKRLQMGCEDQQNKNSKVG